MLNTQQIIQEADRCVACGLCLPHCPTYHKTGSEADSPRGRIQLMSAVAREIVPANDRYKQHIDLCLSCRSCEAACPNGVKYGALIDTARAGVAKKPHVIDKITNHLVANPSQMRVASKVLRFTQNTGLMRLAGQLVPSLNKPIALLSNLQKTQTWREFYPAHSTNSSVTKKGEVSLFLGCISSAFDAETVRASVFVLNRLGFDVHIPLAQSCCGGLARQQGDAEQAKKTIAKNQAAFNSTLPVMTLASGCGAGLHDYTNLVVKDISHFLVNCDWSNINIAPLARDIVVHDPCTLRNVQKSHTSVYDLLNKIPQIKVNALSGNNQCCGGAGAYMLNQPEMADSLLNDKVSSLKKQKATLLATSNIGCALHIAAGLRAQNMAIEVVHPVTIIAKQLGYTDSLDCGSLHSNSLT